jgi:hypothetical protein
MYARFLYQNKTRKTYGFIKKNTPESTEHNFPHWNCHSWGMYTVYTTFPDTPTSIVCEICFFRLSYIQIMAYKSTVWLLKS